MTDNSVAPPGQIRSTVALVGNPNVGKTSVFNRLTRMSSKTSNFVGTTIEKRVGTLDADGQRIQIVDLPGLFSLDANSPEEAIAKSVLEGEQGGRPDGVIVVVDATNLGRSLFVAGQTVDLGLPTVVAVNMVDVSRQQNRSIDFESLSAELHCPVLPISARTGEGFEALRHAIAELKNASPQLSVLQEPLCTSCSACPYADGHAWASAIARRVTMDRRSGNHEITDRLDRILTHAWSGPVLFFATMLCVFALVFWLATYPMDWIEASFGWLAAAVSQWLPAGDINSLITDGMIGGAGSVVVFLPQICILFFALSLLEDSGYLSRAVVVVDRWMRRVGLPGQAFVPLLTAHACAIPAIMSTKVIENRRDRLAAIMVIPLMTCSARLPVYSMVAALLFPNNAWQASLLFVSAYVLGMVMAFLVAWLLKQTLLPGNASLLILDLPAYHRPSVKDALLQAYRRGVAFLRDAGTVILAISMGIWALSTYPKLDDASFQSLAATKQIQLDQLDEATQEVTRAQLAQEYSLIGRAGKLVQPVFQPLGYDWKTSVGVLSSFAAREVVVSTLSVLYGLGEEADDVSSLRQKLKEAKNSDGSRVFTTATSLSLLVFFVLAMQCLPTQAVTRRETGSWKWAAFQFTYMSLLAYGAALLVYQVTMRLG